MTFDYDEWKKGKQEKGEWMSPEMYFLFKRDQQAKKDRWIQEKKSKGEWLPLEDYLSQQEKEGKLRRKRKREVEADTDVILKSHELVLKRSKLEQSVVRREVIFDTETTGLRDEDRIIEISFIEVIDGIKTGRSYHSFFNPEVNVTQKAYEIHRITNESVKDSPLFKDKVEEMIEFIGDSHLVAHNAKFDMNMINKGMIDAGWDPYPESRFIDTLKMARFLYPKDKKHRQDDLCIKFKLDNKQRLSSGIHSAVEDTALLYHIYTRMCSELKEQSLSPYDFCLE
jgi:DNA polymerase III subunit epsilon